MDIRDSETDRPKSELSGLGICPYLRTVTISLGVAMPAHRSRAGWYECAASDSPSVIPQEAFECRPGSEKPPQIVCTTKKLGRYAASRENAVSQNI